MISESSEDSFYITLSSNGSNQSYSNNSPTHFFNILNNRIHLNDSWMVGLSEIHIPLTCDNVILGQNIIWYDNVKYKIAQGYYSTVQQLLDELNKINSSIKFEYSNIVTVHVDDSIKSLRLSSILALQLGFEPNINILKDSHIPKQPFLNIGYPHQMFVYTDIIQPQFVGDTKAPLLRIISITDNHHGKVQTITFQNVHYFPLAKLSFDTVEILLKDHAGRNLPFASGTLTLTLHFKRSSK